jgi:hypothetical protein
MLRSAKLRLPFAAVASLLPLLAPGESHLATGHGSASEQSVATAHVTFKIVIPQTLAMEFAGTEPHRLLLSAAGHRSIARFESCLPVAAASAPRSVSCTVSTP